MPRPIRRPKRAPKTVSVGLGSRPASETQQDSIEPDLFEKKSQTPKQRGPAVRAPRPSSSDDEFGFFQVRDIVPVMHRTARQVPAAAIVVRPDTDAESESELSTLSTISTPSASPEPTPRVTRPRQPLKTVDLINLLPRAHLMKKKRKSLDREAPDDDDSDEDVVSSKRTKRKLPKSAKADSRAGATKVAARRQRAPTPLLTDDEDDAGGDHDTLGLSVEARRKLDKIKAQFEEVDEWHMETETISSPFYSS
ncbi:protein of unknown function [Taphrina deformans PYCC 5710]|uniref:Uncharacterized protein n=1 Tax=Taphrina deformans (strain PYCC 5710 / ATCC 11124 / CBS 356.35 / IMI 108563 / JCM 9778 / NBRC 8474) TaxID=1097556 RepID=R4XKS2_TAPDE|nr:protein of unknown function [Taphrina deformans PYCC 5710]|eukprot:CCG85024.1 protein of unknown function [Taphrina deformans PYCC 5710]